MGHALRELAGERLLEVSILSFLAVGALLGAVFRPWWVPGLACALAFSLPIAFGFLGVGVPSDASSFPGWPLIVAIWAASPLGLGLAAGLGLREVARAWRRRTT